MWYGPTIAKQAHITAMVEVTLTLPDQLARSFGDTPSTQARRVLENTVIEEYRAGRLSRRQLGDVLGLDYWQTDAFMFERKVPLNYTVDDLDADRATLDRVLGKP